MMSAARRVWFRHRQTVGIVGAGAVALDIHIPALLGRRDTRIAWIADTSQAALRRARQRYGLPCVLLAESASDLPASDVVLLALPVGVRAAYHAELSRRGCRVYVEKPFARTNAEALAILQAYAPGRLICGYQRRCYLTTDTLRDLAIEGKFGRVRRVRVSEGALTMATGMSSDFRDDPQMSGGGILIDLGCHGIDLAFHITGSTGARILSQRVVFDAGIDRDVRLRAELTGAGGPIELLVELSWLRNRGREFLVEFDHAVARVGVQAGDRLEITAKESGRMPGLTAAPGVASVWSAVSRAWSVLLYSQEGDSGGIVDPYTYIPAVTLIEQAYAGARTT